MYAFFSGLTELLQSPLEFLQTLLYRVPATLIALILHEWAHGYVAYRLGDPTAKMMGRLSLNPLHHLDPLGTALLFFAGFGWAKPVPVDPRYFKHKHRDDLLVSVAGITMNLLLFLAFYTLYYAVLRVAVSNGYLALWRGSFYYAQGKSAAFDYVMTLLQYTAALNLSLAVFNLLPVPPLDGSHLFNDLFLKKSLFASRTIARYGMGVVMLLSLTGVLGRGLGFVTNAAMSGMDALLMRVFFGA